MNARMALFVAWQLFICAMATYGSAMLAIGLGLGPTLGTILASAVFVSSILLLDRPTA